jgi:hypothetical protein
MTAEWYDLAQRLYAARLGRAVPRLAAAPLSHADNPVAVTARRAPAGITVTAAAPGMPGRTATGTDALALLHDLGVTITAGAWRTLVITDTATLPALLTLARRAKPDGNDAATAAHLAWWGERSDYPGSSAVADLLTGCRARWITGTTPEAERHPATWRAWLGIPGDGCAAMLATLDRLQADGPLRLLDSVIGADDAKSWNLARRDHADQRDWTRPDSAARAAAGLRSRCDTADTYQAALLTDPLYRQRAVHTGHVVTGTVGPQAGPKGPLTITCHRMDARLRAGTDITGWAGTPADADPRTFAGTITGTDASAGALVLTLTATALNRPGAGQCVTLHQAAPGAHVIADGQRRLRSLYGTRTSWLTTGRTPAPARREIPLDVLVAAAVDPASPASL